MINQYTLCKSATIAVSRNIMQGLNFITPTFEVKKINYFSLQNEIKNKSVAFNNTNYLHLSSLTSVC